ncbi:hypothetical protein RSOLAG1IB_12363 [Rhizoctonia solani AG-1 IB]|uniref:Transmembrane protein n=1 Tax=Thanatephorus cucumeris (strain AG1-IB / isolate 7/3/14) TaxID=1108050 RepID=A0A0B7FW31_THACB|nr:hypothetical protein RSOLAG1IB_12363 [Rhizoctonia solani AG-1 IB]
MFGSTYSDNRTYGSTTKNSALHSEHPIISEGGEYALSPAQSESEEFRGGRRGVRTQSVDEYVLPPAVRDAKQAWTVWSQGIAVTTALFAGVEAQLFNLIDETSSPTNSLTQAFRIFSYLGLLSNLLATTSALFVLERVSGLSTRARKLSLLPNSLPRQVADGVPLPANLLHPLRETALLRAFGMDATWGYTITMFYLFSIAGCLSVFVQLSLYLFIRESVAIAVVLTSVIMFGLTPIVVLTLRIVYEFLFELLGWARPL